VTKSTKSRYASEPQPRVVARSSHSLFRSTAIASTESQHPIAADSTALYYLNRSPRAFCRSLRRPWPESSHLQRRRAGHHTLAALRQPSLRRPKLSGLVSRVVVFVLNSQTNEPAILVCPRDRSRKLAKVTSGQNSYLLFILCTHFTISYPPYLFIVLSIQCIPLPLF